MSRTPRIKQRAPGTGTIQKMRHSNMWVAFAPIVRGETGVEIARSQFRFRVERALDEWLKAHGKAAA